MSEEETKTHRVPVNMYLDSLTDMIHKRFSNDPEIDFIVGELHKCIEVLAHTRLLVEYESTDMVK